jgi:hypothetical protein
MARERETYRGSQVQFTRSHAAQVSVEDQIAIHREQYKIHRVALLNLRGPGDWEKKLQELNPEDVRGISEKVLKDLDREIYRQTQIMAGVSVHEADLMANDLLPEPGGPSLSIGDGKRIISWIWTSRRGSQKNSSAQDDAGEWTGLISPAAEV